MLSDLRHTTKHILIYSLGNLSTKLIGFVLLPLYTDYLSTSEYGMLAILEVTSFMLIAFVGMRQSTAMMRWGSAEKDKGRFGSIAFTILMVLVFLGAGFNLIFQPLAGTFGRILFESSEYGNYFHVLFAFVSFEVLNVWVLDLIRVKGKPMIYVVLSLIKFTVILTLNIYFIKFKGLGVLGIILSQFIGSVLLFVISIRFVVKNVLARIEWKEIRPMFNYGFPLVFTTISMYVLSLGDRYLMKYMLDLDAVGVYALGYKIATITNLLIIQSFQIGFLPIAYKMYEQKNKERFFVKSLTYYGFVLVLFSLVLSMFSRELLFILSKSDQYLVAYTIVPFISLALIFKGIQYVFSLSLHFVKKTKYNSFIVLLVAVFNLGLNYLLLPIMGIYGAGMASIVSFFIMLMLFRIFARKFYDPGYEIHKLILLVVVGVVLYFISLISHQLSIALSIAVKTLLLLLFPFVLYPFGFYEAIEISRIKGGIQKWKNPFDWRKNIKDFLKS